MHWERRSAVLAVGLAAFVLAAAGCSWHLMTPTASERPAPKVAASAPTSAPPSVTSPAAMRDEFKPLGALKDVHFGPGSVDALQADTGILDAVVGWLKENPTELLLVEGYTDDLGTKEQNRALGEKRAKAVMKYFVSRGLEAARITTASHGADHPVCSEKTEGCRAKNRRVRFLIKQL